MQTKTIELANNGTVLVDESDYAELSKHFWFKTKLGYAARQGWDGPQGKGGKHWIVWMHRVINGTPDHLFTDHVNGNKLDNRRSNLRTCNKAQNSANRPKIRRGLVTSGLKGVSYHPSTKLWRARVYDAGYDKTTYHRTEHDAAFAYNQMARERFGEFAQFNPMPEGFVPGPSIAQKYHSKFKGVSRSRKGVKWVASIYPNGGKEKHLGTFSTELEAAAAYNVAALDLYGSRAKLNQI